MTEAVLCKLDEPCTILLQCAQKLAVLELDLELKAITKVLDEVYVNFHFLLVRFLLQVISTLLGIDEAIIIILGVKIEVIHPIFCCVHSAVLFSRCFVVFITNCGRFFIHLDLQCGY